MEDISCFSDLSASEIGITKAYRLCRLWPTKMGDTERDISRSRNRRGYRKTCSGREQERGRRRENKSKTRQEGAYDRESDRVRTKTPRHRDNSYQSPAVRNQSPQTPLLQREGQRRTWGCETRNTSQDQSPAIRRSNNRTRGIDNETTTNEKSNRRRRRRRHRQQARRQQETSESEVSHQARRRQETSEDEASYHQARRQQDTSESESSEGQGRCKRRRRVGRKVSMPKQGEVNNNAELLLTELIKSLNHRPEGNKFPILGNVIPEFDPMVKGQTVAAWLNKVDECARLYNWGEDQIIHYALPKLCGVAKTWYQALPSMSFSWPEWKVKLTDSFPASDDFAELLNEMLSKKLKYNDSGELYYYEKINLLTRCEIYGKRAVDCLLFGIEDRSLRLGAKAAKCTEPEQVLQYFQSIKQARDFDSKAKVFQEKKLGMNMNNASTNVQAHNNKPFHARDTSKAKTVCFNCNETGHFSFRCTKKILKCNVCSRMGHVSTDCPRLPSNSNNKFDSSKEKTVMKL